MAQGELLLASPFLFPLGVDLGLGYLAIEIALLQKFGLFLGHPNYSLSVVLAALLFGRKVAPPRARKPARPKATKE